MTAVPPHAAQLDAALQQAIRLHQGGRPAEAERIYRNLLHYLPGHPRICNYLGIALKDQGKVVEAAAAFQRAVDVAPDFVPALSNLGNVLFEQGKRAEAEAVYRRVLASGPDMPDTLKNLALLIVDSGRFAESFPYFRRHAELTYGGAPGAARAHGQTPPYKAKHDEEQREYLKRSEEAGAGATPPFHLEEGARVAGNAVNPDTSGGEIAAKWANRSPQIAVIDNLLTDEALDRLRQYCLRSTMWQKPYPNGYLGAMPEHGFACPLLAQIADELRGAYPAIIGEHPVLRWWGFKYDSQLTGINIHADFAAINVNFWITPDEANRDPESGGLIVWDTPAPLDWTFAQYNAPDAGQRIRDLLAQTGAKSVNVPYRANRAVIFDSDLFHETDRIAFEDGYENRRMNITLLYGRREAAAR